MVRPGSPRLGLVLLLAAASLGPRPLAAEEPWGYLWHVRTLQVFALDKDVVRLGRLRDADVVLTDPHVSRRHAEIRREGDAVVIVDVRSTNGSAVNGELLRPGVARPLEPGDHIRLATESLLFHRERDALWADMLRYGVLGRFARLRAPILKDRTVRSLGRERTIPSTTTVRVDLDTSKVLVEMPEEGRSHGRFEAGEAVFVARATIEDGELRLSLWGLEREGTLLSRRAAFSELAHAELVLGLAGEAGDARRRFEEGWRRDGLRFLSPVLFAVLELFAEDTTVDLAVDLARSLVDRTELVALRDAANVLAHLHDQRPTDPELPALAARARARWVKAAARDAAALEDPLRTELAAALAEGRALARKAAALGADEAVRAAVETEIVEAERLLAGGR